MPANRRRRMALAAEKEQRRAVVPAGKQRIPDRINGAEISQQNPPHQV